MFTLLIFFFGMIIGLLLAFLSFWIIKIKCPGCKQLRTLKEIVVFSWKTLIITGQACLKCKQIGPQEIML